MNKEEIYKFGDFVITYDKGVNNDRSCLIISKVDKINIYVLGELYDESADIINTIINNLQQQNQKYKEVIDKAIEYISNKKAIINTDVIRIFDLFEIDEQGYTDKLLDILKEVK